MIGTHNVLGRFLLDALRNYEQDMAYLHFRVAEISEIQWLLQSIVHSLIAPKAAGLQIRRTEMGLLFLHLLSRPECMRMPAATHQENLVVIELLQEIRQNYADFCAARFRPAQACVLRLSVQGAQGGYRQKLHRAAAGAAHRKGQAHAARNRPERDGNLRGGGLQQQQLFLPHLRVGHGHVSQRLAG